MQHIAPDFLGTKSVDASLSGSTIFSILDLHSGYWQLPVHPDDYEKTTFLSTQTDASTTGLGVVLAYASRTFTQPERKLQCYTKRAFWLLFMH